MKVRIVVDDRVNWARNNRAEPDPVLPNTTISDWQGPLPQRGDPFDYRGESLSVQRVLWELGEGAVTPQVVLRLR